MKKIISILLVLVVLVSLTGCFNNNGTSIDYIDFENSTLNINTEEIDQYIEDAGYTSYSLTFDVDKSIYQCKVSLSEEESAKIVIDGNGYDSFIASARTFLTNGTDVMSDVLAEYNLTGISCGMFLTSNDDVVYCSVIDGSVNYIAHLDGDTTSIGDVRREIEKIANEILNDKLKISIDNAKRLVSVFYEGKQNGGSEQTQNSVQRAYDAVRAYLDETGLKNYTLKIYSYDGSPATEDQTTSSSTTNTSSENNNERTDGSTDASNTNSQENEDGETLPNSSAYTCIAKTLTNYYVLEAIATKKTAESVANGIIQTAKKDLQSDCFIFYIVDENQRLLGCGNVSGYEPYVFQNYTSNVLETPSYEIPFQYYIYKYFNNIEFNGWECEFTLLPGGIDSYTFYINAVDIGDKAACKTSAETIVSLMNLTLGEDIEIVVKIYANTENEIVVKTNLQEN